MLTIVSIEANSQIDFSTDVSSAGIFTNVKATYPIDDIFLIGASYGNNLYNPLISDRIDLVLGVYFHQWLQIEADLGFVTGYKNYTDRNLKVSKRFIPHIDFGAKFHFANNLFIETKVSYPMFCKIGFGVRLRPYNKLTVWDRQ